MLKAAERRDAKRAARSGHTVPQVATIINKQRQQPVSQATVRRVLKGGKCPLQWVLVNRGRALSSANKQKRLKFCQDHLTAQSGSWLYGDSKLLYLYQDGPASNTWGWHDTSKEQQQRRAGNPTVFHFYAVVGKGCKSPLVYTAPSAPAGTKQRKGRESFASKHYIKVAQQLHNTIKAWGKDSKRHPLVMDKAKQHTSKASTAAINAMGLHLKQGFPAQCWDINIIENVWGVLDTKLRHLPGRLPTTPDGWRRRINMAWEAIDQSTIDMLVGSVNSRMNEIVQKEGAWLSKHS